MKGHWVRVYEGKSDTEALRVLAKERSLGHKAKFTKKRLGIGWWRTVWRWARNR